MKIKTFNIIMALCATLSSIAQTYSREQGLADFERSRNALIKEIPHLTIKNFNDAFTEIKRMLEGHEPLSFKRAVFLVENCYFDNTLNWNDFNETINDIVQKLNSMIKNKGLSHFRTSGNWATFQYMFDSIHENKFKPYTYDVENFMTDNDHTSYMVTQLLDTRKGNCRSLPFLYNSSFGFSK